MHSLGSQISWTLQWWQVLCTKSRFTKWPWKLVDASSGSGQSTPLRSSRNIQYRERATEHWRCFTGTFQTTWQTAKQPAVGLLRRDSNSVMCAQSVTLWTVQILALIMNKVLSIFSLDNPSWPETWWIHRVRRMEDVNIYLRLYVCVWKTRMIFFSWTLGWWNEMLTHEEDKNT